MIKLSKMEQAMFDLLKANEGKDVRLEELCSVAYAKKARPANWRKSVAGTMRYLIMKRDGRGVRIERTSRLGAHSTATYRLTVAGSDRDDLPRATSL